MHTAFFRSESNGSLGAFLGWVPQDYKAIKMTAAQLFIYYPLSIPIINL
jgi:hypothetical protein